MARAHYTVSRPEAPQPVATTTEKQEKEGRKYCYLTKTGVDGLKNYKYVGSSYSWIDTNLGTPFWNWAVTLLPMWLAPNVVTLCALACAAVSTVLVFIYAPLLDVPLPPRVSLFLAVSLFLYQTLDAIDGKQARRTGSSSPLGQLFDHGCDSVCSVLLSVQVAACLRLGTLPLGLGLLASLLLHVVPFYLANWEESVTGIMRFGAVGVTEAQLLAIAIFLVTAYDADIWVRPLGSHLTVRAVFIVVALLATVQTCVLNVTHARRHLRHKEMSVSKHWHTLREFLVYVVLVSAWFMSPQGRGLLQSHAALALFFAGLPHAHLVSRLIVSHTAHMSFGQWHRVLWPLPVLVVVAYSEHTNPHLACACFSAAWVFWHAAHYAVVTSQEIAHALDIHVLSLKSRVIVSTRSE